LKKFKVRYTNNNRIVHFVIEKEVFADWIYIFNKDSYYETVERNFKTVKVK